MNFGMPEMVEKLSLKLFTVFSKGFDKNLNLQKTLVFKTQIFEFYDKIVKSIVMVFFVPNKTQVIQLKSNTSPICEGMNSRAFSKKVKNRPKLRFMNFALELNPFTQGS